MTESWDAYAEWHEPTASEPDGFFWHVQDSERAVLMYGAKEAVPVCLSADPDGRYYGWMTADPESRDFGRPVMVQPRRMLFDMQFTYGLDAAVAAEPGNRALARGDRRDA